MKNVFILLADGFEEIEALAPADLLRRAEIDVTLVSISPYLSVKGARGVTVCADALISDIKKLPDMVLLPGGFPGYKSLAESVAVLELVKKMLDEDRYIAAICGAPAAVLGKNGLLRGKKAVCYPGMEGEMEGARVADLGVCVDSRLITAKSAGYAIDFALEIIRALAGGDAAEKVRAAIVYNG